MIFRKHAFAPPAWLLLCCFFGIFWVMPFTFPVIAQDTQTEADEKTDPNQRIGFSFSLSGMIADILPGPFNFYGQGNIEESEDDGMPYPTLFFSTRYDKYQLLIG